VQTALLFKTVTLFMACFAESLARKWKNDRH